MLFVGCMALGLLGVASLLLGYATCLSRKPLSGNPLKENLDRKLAMAQVPGAKLIILSGSNGEFGYSAQMLEQELRVPAVNMGEHAGQGLDYILYRGSLAAQKGDLFVLPLEYEQYASIEPSGDQTCMQVILHDAAYRRSLGFWRWARLVFSIPLKTWSRVVPLEWHAGMRSDAEPIDGWGDPTRDTDPVVIQKTIMELSHEAPRGMTLSSESIDDLKRFHALLQARGARMVVIFPCIYRPLLANGSPQFQANVASLRRALTADGIPLLGNPEDFTFEASEVYDTVYHENAAGREHATKRLITMLQAHGLVAPVSAQ
ncbi:hypothetical protein [Silvibacterium dinghuense]|uniref:SGNH/GDSL hydrolase family protein n=1 Tax=Silvibacterium dinghuense TaxID=1560006 RepID=A0A4V1NV48_9BACT|nr:hypothetical protein [Silvibacterium dinghuense]RXS94512.1 hypothetical protein ESZ00_15710 [Silvibacterium dinghuense]GGH15650.1 hypothetical protein GCM10011586_36880 [Silvibacterium dinghuense]